eukprot:Pompholyxophrys_punicea_v1_NODE_1180_length_884_cov_2.700844.p1 type:complete len:103 gc:universal NODE_1180_length_884_cov_2.700844:559-867(+)
MLTNPTHSYLFISSALQSSLRLNSPTFQFEGVPLANLSTAKFLGLHLNSSLTWTDHIEALIRKLARFSGFSGLFYMLKSCLPTSALLSLYNALILPHHLHLS